MNSYELEEIQYGEPNWHEFEKFNILLTSWFPDYRPWYIILNKKSKDPSRVLSLGWKRPSAQVTAKHAVKWMKRGHNIGIAGTPNDTLVIVDVDDELSVPKEQLKPTLTVRSRKRAGRHHYFFTHDKPLPEDEHGNKIPGRSAKCNIPCEHAGEIRSDWQYVVAPGSFVPTAGNPSLEPLLGYYTVETELCPNIITFDELPDVYKLQMEISIRDYKEQKALPQSVHHGNAKSGLFSLTVQDVLGHLPQHGRFPSPLHGSETGFNTSFDGKLLHCWRHNVSHTALSVLAVLSGHTECIDAGKSHRGSTAGSSCICQDNGEAMFAIWKYAKDHGIISADDPMPSSALMWFAEANGMCKSTDYVNGKLPVSIYIEAKELVKAVGLA